MSKRLMLVAGMLMSVALTGCSKVAGMVDQQPPPPCTAFGCTSPGNILHELWGAVLIGIVLFVIIVGVVRRMTK